MTAKTSGSENQRKDWIIQECPMIADEIIYKGSTVILDSSSKLAKTNDGTVVTLAAGDIFAGIAVETVDSTGFIAWATYVRAYRTGSHLLTFTDTLTQADVWKKVYINNTTDDAAVTVTKDSWVDVMIWYVVEFVSASTAIVSIKTDTVAGTDGDLIWTNDIADDAVTNAKAANMIRGTVKVWGTADAPTDLVGSVSWQILVGDGTDIKSVAVSWDATLAANGALTLANDSVDLAKLDIEIATVTVSWATTGTATVTTGSQILGWYVTAISSTATVKLVDVSSTTLTVTLSASDTATVKVVLLKA